VVAYDLTSVRITGVDLSKILRGTKILGDKPKYSFTHSFIKILGERVVIADESIGVSQLLGGTCSGCRAVYTYG